MSDDMEKLRKGLLDLSTRLETIESFAGSTGGDLARVADLRAQIDELGDLYIDLRRAELGDDQGFP